MRAGNTVLSSTTADPNAPKVRQVERYEELRYIERHNLQRSDPTRFEKLRASWVERGEPELERS